MELLIKNKPSDKVSLITDAMRAKGLPDGESELGGQKVFVKGGEARLADGTLAGSVLKMNVALKNMVEKVGIPLETAIRFATINPATLLGIDKEYGSIKVGKRASFAVIDKDFNVIMTVRDGKVIYKA
jgi:N-acetylglucosamine-6-phosphate deacetylase